MMALDSVLIFKGEIARACGGVEGGTEAFGDVSCGRLYTLWHKKTDLWGLQPGLAQICFYSHRIRLEN